MTTGIERIAAERKRQVEEEGWTAEHDADHTDYSLAMAACCYAMPVRLYEKYEHAAGVNYVDPWPNSWDDGYDKRFEYGERRENRGNVPPDPGTYTTEEYLDLLTKAGALLAAEIDRIQAEARKEGVTLDGHESEEKQDYEDREGD